MIDLEQEVYGLAKKQLQKGDWAAVLRLFTFHQDKRLFDWSFDAVWKDSGWSGWFSYCETAEWIFNLFTMKEVDHPSSLKKWSDADALSRCTLECIYLIQPQRNILMSDDLADFDKQKTVSMLFEMSVPFAEKFAAFEEHWFSGNLYYMGATALRVMGGFELANDYDLMARDQFFKEENVALSIQPIVVVQKGISDFHESNDEAELSIIELQSAYRMLKEYGPVQGLDIHVDIGTVISNLANSLGNNGQYEESEEKFKEAIAFREKNAELSPQSQLVYLARSQNRYGKILNEANRFEDARSQLLKAIKNFKTVDDNRWEKVDCELGDSWEAYGGVLMQLERISDAERAFRNSLELYGDNISINRVKCLKSFAVLKDNQDKAAEAASLLGTAIQIFESLPDIEQRASLMEYSSLLQNLANLHSDKLQNGKVALELYEQAIEIRESLSKASTNNLIRYARTLSNAGNAQSEWGSHDKASEWLEESCKILRELVDDGRLDLELQLSFALNNLARVSFDRGKPEDALALFEEAIKLKTASVDDFPFEGKLRLISSLLGHANVASELGRFAVANTVFEKANQISNGFSEDQKHVSNDVILSLASNYACHLERIGLIEEAENEYLRATRLMEFESGQFDYSRQLKLTIYSNLSALYIEQDRFLQAEQCLDKAFSHLSIDDGKLSDEEKVLAVTLLNRSAYCDLGVKPMATAHAKMDQATQLAKQLGDTHCDIQMVCFYCHGIGNWELCQKSSSLEYANAALDNFLLAQKSGERFLARSSDPIRRIEIRERLRLTYEKIVAIGNAIVQLQTGEKRQIVLSSIFDACEKMKGSLLKDLFNDQVVSQAVPKQIFEDYQSLKGRLHNQYVNNRIDHSGLTNNLPLARTPNTGESNNASFDSESHGTQSTDLEQSFSKMVRNIRNEFGVEFEPSDLGQSCSLSEAKELLPDDTSTILQWALVDEGISIIVLGKGYSHNEIIMDAEAKEVRELLGAWVHIVGDVTSENGADMWANEAEKLLQRLSELLIYPIKEHLENTERLIISPHQQLHLLPFGTLRIDEERRLCDKFDLVLVPSLSILSHLQNNRSQNVGDEEKDVLPLVTDVENPDFYVREAEVAIISHMLDTRPVPCNGTRETIEKCANSSVFHFSGHGVFNSDSPINSHLLDCKNEKLMSVEDIFTNLRMERCSLITLSACESSLFQTSDLDEFVSFTTGFLYSGARSVVTSLWEVLEFPTFLLMTRLYENLLEGHSVAFSLRMAQNWLRGKKDHKNEAIVSGEEVREFLARYDGVLNELDPLDKESCEMVAEPWIECESAPFADPMHWASFVAHGCCWEENIFDDQITQNRS